MADLTNNPRDARPEWASRIIDALQDASCWGAIDDRLTPAERDLINGVELRLRHRLGESGSAGVGLDLLAAFVMERGTKAVTAEQGRS
jgi:hypothetical protein